MAVPFIHGDDNNARRGLPTPRMRSPGIPGATTVSFTVLLALSLAPDTALLNFNIGAFGPAAAENKRIWSQVRVLGHKELGHFHPKPPA